MTATVIRGDARSLPLADNSVDLVVSSPPYFALRSYQDGGEHYAGQIGDEPTPGEFVDSLVDVTRECVRVVKQSGSLWINLGDKYSDRAGPEFVGSSDGMTGRYGKGPRKNTTTVAPRKSLLGIPWRYALRCIDDLGLILRAEIIWSKPNGLPESVTDRVRRSHEQWFHFTLEPRYYSAVDEIREEHSGAWKSPGGGMPGKALGPAARNGHSQWERTRDERDATVRNPLGKLPGSVWEIATEPLKVPAHLGIDHFAAFPTEWPRRIIQGWSPPGNCTTCGEGRRPVTVVAHETLRGQNTTGRPKKQDLSGDRNNGWNKPGYPKTREHVSVTGYACACTPWHMETQPTESDPFNQARVYDWHLWDAAPTTPAVVLDPFGGTGTTALAARALGRHGISVDMSADYCRLAAWRTTDERQLAGAMRIAKPAVQVDGQVSMFDLLEEGA